MIIINHLKDGTVVDDMSKVTVPEEIQKSIIKILESKVKKIEKTEKDSDSN